MIGLTPIAFAVYIVLLLSVIAAVELVTGERISDVVSERAFIALVVAVGVVSVPVSLVVFAYVTFGV